MPSRAKKTVILIYNTCTSDQKKIAKKFSIFFIDPVRNFEIFWEISKKIELDTLNALWLGYEHDTIGF